MCLVNEEIVTVKLNGYSILQKGLSVVRSNRLGYVDIRVPEGMDVVTFVGNLESSGLYEIVKYADIAETCITPNDPYIANQWYLTTIDMYNSWGVSMGNSSVKVAVLDREVDWSHEDLGYGTDGYTHVDWQSGYNYMENTNNAVTPHNHGTMVAGIIGAKTNNAKGIAGISGGNNTSGITIIPYCVGSVTGINHIDMTTVDDAILDAVDKGVKVINMSFRSTSFYHPDVDDAIEYAYENGVTIVAATGNDYANTVYYPASNAYVIAVGATNQENQRCSFSNYGDELDLVAPGKDIYSTTLQNSYDYGSGTSFAAPQVSGVAALMLSVNSSLTPESIRNILNGTAQRMSLLYTFNGDSWNDEVGHGILDAYASVCLAKAKIDGNSVLCSSNTYYIDDLPSGMSVAWSISGTTPSSLTLTQNSPSANQCTITRSGYAEFSYITLCANIVRDGVTLRTLTKRIYRDNFSGTYEEQSSSYNGHDYPAISTTAISNRSATYVYINGIVTLYSDYFRNKELTTSGPYTYFSHLPGNRVRFSLSSANLSQPFTITVPASGCDDEVRLTFYAHTPYLGLSLNIIPVGERKYKLYLNKACDDGDNEKSYRASLEESQEKNADNLKDIDWKLEITNATTGRKAASISLKEPTYLLDATGWETGIYVVRALVGEESLAGKITVK